MGRWWIGFALGALVCVVAGEIRASEPNDPSPTPEAASSDDSNSPVDVVHLVSGKQITGTVLLQSGAQVIIEVHPGVPLHVPARQVARIEIADRPDEQEGEEGTGDGDSGANVVSGVRMSEKLGRSLSAIVPVNSGKEFHDVLEVFQYLSEQMSVNISIAQEVRTIAEERLAWSGQLEEGQTLYEIVQGQIAEKYRGAIRIELGDDRIRVLPAEPTS